MRLIDFVRTLDDPRQPIIQNIYYDHEYLFDWNPGSTHIHQTWEGGLADHLADMLRLSVLEYAMLSAYLAGRGEELPFTLASAQIVIFCHDAEKVIIYGDRRDPRCARYVDNVADPTDKAFKENLKWDILRNWQADYGLVLTDAEINAIKYTHGEGEDYRNDRRVMNELAAFVGNIDRTSARILYDSGHGLG